MTGCLRGSLLAMLVGAAVVLPMPVLADGPPTAPARDPYTYTPAPERLFYNWSGIYFGGHMGGSSSKWSSVLDSGLATTESARANSSDFFGGGQVGYQHHWRDFVIGAEVVYSELGAQFGTSSLLTPTLNVASEVKGMLQVNGKLGYAYMNYLTYLKGGYVSASTSTSTSGLFTASSSGTARGWLGAIGVSYAVHPNVILSAEYDYIRLNGDSVGLTDGTNVGNFSGSRWDIQQATLRLDLKFGPR